MINFLWIAVPYYYSRMKSPTSSTINPETFYGLASMVVGGTANFNWIWRKMRDQRLQHSLLRNTFELSRGHQTKSWTVSDHTAYLS